MGCLARTSRAASDEPPFGGFSVSITSRFPGLLTKQEQTRWYGIVLAGIPGMGDWCVESAGKEGPAPVLGLVLLLSVFYVL